MSTMSVIVDKVDRTNNWIYNISILMSPQINKVYTVDKIDTLILLLIILI